MTNFYKFSFKKGTILDSTILFPVYRLNMDKKTVDPPPLSPGARNFDPLTHLACSSEGKSEDTLVNTDCFNDYDPTLLGNIDPDINYLNSNKKV